MNAKKILKSYFRRVLFKLLPELNSLNRQQSENRFDLQMLADHYDTHSPEYLKLRDAELIRKRFRKLLNHDPDLKNPMTFNEKTQWLKLNYRKQDLHLLADKYMVRKYISNAGFEKYLNTLYGVYTSSEELIKDWDALPASFIIKTNHWSGGNLVVKNKSKFDRKKLSVLDEWLNKNYYHHKRWGEWIYKNIEPRIVVEKYLTSENSADIKDYRLFCFNGKVKYIMVDVDTLGSITKRVIYDLNWQKQDFTITRPIYQGEIPRPAVLDEMINFAESVAMEHPFLRVDMYLINNDQIFFGELTFFHQSGFGKFIPQKWDKVFGDLINLPSV